MIRIKLTELLKEKNLSQRELARRTGTHPDVISRFARGVTNGVSYNLLNRICRALQCQPGDLLEYTPEQYTLFDKLSGT